MGELLEEVTEGEHIFFPALDSKREENEAVLMELGRLMEKGGNVVLAKDCGILDEVVYLPFLQTPLGDRKFGLGTIRKYVRGYKKSYYELYLDCIRG
jgi:hypothetical protein